MLRIYNTVLLPLRTVTALWAVWQARDPARAHEWAERRARALPDVTAGGIWIHGASVGEARVVAALAEGVRGHRSELPVSVSATTPAGRERLPGPPATDAAFFVPLDFARLPGRILDAVRPSALVLVETELWPNLLHEALARDIPVAVVNGRLAPERMARYRRLGRLYRPLIAGIAAVGAQSDEEAGRFLDLGARPQSVIVTGNAKYDLPGPRESPARLRSRFGLAADRPVVAAGSTGQGEDASVLRAYAAARREHPDLFLILAPRHLHRADEADREAAALGVRLHRLSSGGDVRAGAADGLLVDTMGELAGLYALARAAFVGGSLVAVGGHNLLEPAAAGVPVLFGPHVHHVAEIAVELERAGGAFRVKDEEELGRIWSALLRDDARCRRAAEAASGVVRTNRGALERSVALVLSLVGEPGTMAEAQRP